MRAAGYDVVVAAGVERDAVGAIEAEGLRFVPLNIRRRSKGLFQELRTIIEIYRLYRREQPDLVHHVTIKPVMYGSLAAKVAGVPATINAITGMGAAFAQPGALGGLLRWGLTFVCRLAFIGDRTRVIFQNPSDREWFVSRRILPFGRAVMVRGSGVDINRFQPSPLPTGVPVVLLASRLLWDKGVGEFVEASRILKGRGVECRFVLVGLPDNENPNPIPTAAIEQWQADSLVEWWGLRDDMPQVLRDTTVVTLPTTYPEGVPKILLEAAASGRAMVATDVPGCREIVADGHTGLLVPPKNPEALADAVQRLLEDRALNARLGANARALAVAEFSEERTIAATIAVYRELLGGLESVLPDAATAR